MPFRFDEYRAAVLLDYERKAAAGLRYNLTHPTPANLKDEALYVCSSRFKRPDEPILIKFFKSQKDQSAYVVAINETDPDDFRPLLNFLRGRTRNPEERVVELLAWLTDYEARPYQNYIVSNHENKIPASVILSGTHTLTEEDGIGNNEGPLPAEEREKKTDTNEKTSTPKKRSMLWIYSTLIILTLSWVWWIQRPTLHPPGSVYICDSQGAKRYHLRKNCSGLRNCKHEIITVSLDSAKKTGRTLCHLEGG